MGSVMSSGRYLVLQQVEHRGWSMPVCDGKCGLMSGSGYSFVFQRSCSLFERRER